MAFYTYRSPTDVSALHSKAADVRIPYGKDPLQFGDLRLPEKSGMHPVAIVIHGGYWVTKFADFKNTAALSDALRDEGIATWNIEYRRIGNIGGGWPGTFQDVAAAVDLLPSIAKKYSLDLSRVIVIGQSSGGHLALWVAARHKLPTSSVLYKKNPMAVRSVISLGGVPNLLAYREYAKNVCDSDVVGKLVGEGTVKNFKEASPSELLPLGTKQILIYGEDEVSVPVKFGDDYKKIASSKGDDVSVITVKRKGELVTAKWTDIDLNQRWWTIAAINSKNGQSHRVYLSDLALEILKELRELNSTSTWLFPSPFKNGEPITSECSARAINRSREIFYQIKAFSAHDLRRTAASHMTAMGISRLTVSKILNHSDNSVTAIYDRHSYDSEKRNALEAWGQQLKQIINFDGMKTNVIQIRNVI